MILKREIDSHFLLFVCKSNMQVSIGDASETYYINQIPI